MPTQHRSRPRTQDRSTASTGEALRSIFNRNFNVVACINLLVMTAYYLMFVTSTAYARATYGASLSSAGLTAGIMVIGCLIGRFLTGNLLSLCGCRAILFAGLLLYSASIAAFFWVPNLALLFVQRLCMGMGVGIMGTATGTIVAYVVPHQHHGLGISLFSMSTAFALALGPFPRHPHLPVFQLHHPGTDLPGHRPDLHRHLLRPARPAGDAPPPPALP